ncbi:MAG: acyl-[acyl-carrier-protein] thioesterase [Lachnospiraceae bacterium]|nr:acyl-[acyl-carrier-protein] thioesterase [Lachnospiraceae bacterium]
MYTFDSRIRYSETDSEGKLTLDALLNYFQDSSTFQSEELDVGISYMRRNNLVWVLSAWQIVVERYPRLGEEVVIGTFPYDFKGFIGLRNFVMMTKEGEYLAKANSLWSLLSTESNKPTLPTAEMLAKYPLEDKLEMDYAPRKIAIPENGATEVPIVVKKHHIDTNHHVNNGQFVNMAMEYLPEGFSIRQMRAEYRMQAFLNDELYPYVARAEEGYVVVLRNQQDKPYVVVEFTGKESV